MNIKVFALLTKLPHLSDAAFHAHWRDPHGTLTRRMRQIHRYVQNHALGPDCSLPGLPSPGFQGVPAIWVEELAALGQMFDDPNYAALAKDAQLLYDQSALVWLITTEQSIKRAREADGAEFKPVKAMAFLKRAAQRDAVGFLAALKDVAAPAATDPRALGCVMSVPVSDAYPAPQEPPFDAVLEVAFADRAAFEQSWPLFQERIASSGLADLLDKQACRGFLAEEERVIWPDP